MVQTTTALIGEAALLTTVSTSQVLLRACPASSLHAPSVHLPGWADS